MRRRIIIGAAGALLALSLAGVAGCAAPAGLGGAGDAARAAGEPALMPASHEGRFQELGAPGCYGCHGAGKDADPLLAQAPALPADHYVDGDPATREVFGPRGECITCHPQG